MKREARERAAGSDRLSLRQGIGIACVSLLIGAGLGWWWGHASRPAAPVRTTPAPAPLATTAPDPAIDERAAELLGESWLEAFLLAARVESLEALLEETRRRRLDPRELARAAIEQLSDEQLRSVIAATTRLGRDELDEVGDLRRFAGRLAEIAMSGVLEPEAPLPAAGAVRFTRTQAEADDASIAATRFEPDEPRIYAAFEAEAGQGETVMLKWFRRDAPEVLLLRRYPIRPGEPFHWVWLDREGGWPPGQYGVDVYSGDDEMRPIARGRYTVE